MYRAFFTAMMIPALAAAQSVYSLEVLPTDHFQASQKFTSIEGLQIDAEGDVTGIAANAAKRVGFYWRSNSGPVRPLVYKSAAGEESCEPRGLDDNGRAYITCGAGAPLALYTYAEDRYEVLRINASGELRMREAAGAWLAGELHNNGTSSAVRVGTNREPEVLQPVNGHRESFVFGVNSKGVAVGSSMRAAGSSASGASSVAVVWPGGKSTPEAISAPQGAAWSPASAVALNGDGDVAGNTSSFPISSACAPPAGVAVPSNRAFVSLAKDGARTAELLPLIPDDRTMTSLSVTGINNRKQIIGMRQGVDCAEAVVIRGQRAALWQVEDGRWTGYALDRLPISFPPQCAHDVVLTSARGINDIGQITGAGRCIDQNEEKVEFAYRLTPIGPGEAEPRP